LARRSMAIEALRHACHAYDRGRTSSASVKWYMDFARNADPTAPSLAQWRALNRRMGFREGMAHFWPPFVLAAVTRRLRDELAYMRWARSGI
jgi:hypothetical protein